MTPEKSEHYYPVFVQNHLATRIGLGAEQAYDGAYIALLRRFDQFRLRRRVVNWFATRFNNTHANPLIMAGMAMEKSRIGREKK